MKKALKYLIRVCLLTAVAALSRPLQSCREEFPKVKEGTVVLEFSQDTVRFDTILTTQASVTQRLMVRNPYKEAVRISRIYLAGGEASKFRINVSGNTDLEQYNVMIDGRDSLYIFINTFVDQQNRDNPLEVWDELCFEVDRNPRQKVMLSVWGQDANYWKSNLSMRVPFYDPSLFNPDDDSLDIRYFVYDESVHRFDNAKPYVIYGYLTVPEGKTLTIPAGTRIYFATQSGIWVQKGARLKIEGILGAPVYMTSIRQDADYRHTAGQWGRIWLEAGSGPHEVDYAFVRNGQTGFWQDSCTENLSEKGLVMRNTRIENMSSYAVFCRSNRVVGENLCCVQAGCILGLFNGGDYEFVHGSFCNNYAGGYGGSRCLSLSNKGQVWGGEESGCELSKALFANCIFTGYNTQQLYVDMVGNVDDYPQISFDHCMITFSPPVEDNAWFNSCLWNEDPHFNNAEVYDLRLKEDSPLVGRGNPDYVRGSCILDLAGRERRTPPSIGAYE